MEQLPQGFTLEICPEGFPLSTDSMALAHFLRLRPQARVLDLGSGCGTLGLLLCAREESCTVTGVELCPQAHATALENIRRNGLASRLSSICGDLTAIPTFLPPGGFDICLSNPPYFSAGPASRTHPQARREDRCDPAALFASAAWALRYGGDFYLVHRPERLAQLCALGAQHGLEAKELLFLRHRPTSAPSLILLRLRKGGKPGLILGERTLFDSDGSPSAYYREVYHMQ